MLRVKQSELKSLPPAEDYLSQIDLDKVAEAILGGGSKLADYDFQEAKTMIWAAAEKWLPRDIYDLEITGVEEMYEEGLTFNGQTQKFKGVKDLKGVLRGRLNATKKYAGKKVVIDWKSTHNSLDTTWDERLMDSFQWRKYLHFEDAEVMIYRGLSREGKTRELIIDRPKNLTMDVLIQLKGVSAARKGLVDSGLDIWPRRMPGSCGAYGRQCPHWVDCREMTMPRGKIPEDKSLSYSSIDRFLMCPERYRRSVLEDAQQEETEESSFGQAVHRGLAELYQQVKERIQTDV